MHACIQCVVSEKFHKLCESIPSSKMKILRIYSRAVEAKDFPGSGKSNKATSQYSCPEWARAYALHYKIRENGFAAKRLIELEQEFQQLPTSSIPNGEICKLYKNALSAAEAEVLSEHFDIVFCTCNETCSTRVTKWIKPRQCIVDECGMVNEPETIVSIASSEHVVLMGDHKQLQPVIDYRPAGENGLSTSLFQRYAEKFAGQYMKTLTVQYRMVRCSYNVVINSYYTLIYFL